MQRSENVASALDFLHAAGMVCRGCSKCQILDCGHMPSPHSECASGYARTDDDKRICYECADARTLESMRTIPRVVLYLDGASVTTWSGGIMGRVVSRVSRRMRTPNARWTHERVFLRVIDRNGRHWYGSGPGDGMYCRLRATRSLPDKRETER